MEAYFVPCGNSDVCNRVLCYNSGPDSASIMPATKLEVMLAVLCSLLINLLTFVICAFAQCRRRNEGKMRYDAVEMVDSEARSMVEWIRVLLCAPLETLISTIFKVPICFMTDQMALHFRTGMPSYSCCRSMVFGQMNILSCLILNASVFVVIITRIYERHYAALVQCWLVCAQMAPPMNWFASLHCTYLSLLWYAFICVRFEWIILRIWMMTLDSNSNYF